MTRGVYFAIDNVISNKLKNFEDEEELLEYILEDIEEEWNEEWLCEVDKAWESIHKVLTDGNLEFDNGSYPLNCVVLGGELLTKSSDEIVVLNNNKTIKDIVNQIKNIKKKEFKDRYELFEKEYTSEDDFDYCWSNFQDLLKFYEKVASSSKDVIFTAY